MVELQKPRFDADAFLASAGREGVTWEAKGPNPNDADEPFHARHVQRAAAGSATTLVAI